jgi:YfiR/HmsC-like
MSQGISIKSLLRRCRMSLPIATRLAAYVGIALAAGPATLSNADSSVPKEYKIKAAFIYNFAKFVEWPAQKLAEDRAPIVIGVLGPNPFGDELENALKGRQINGRPVVVRQFDNPEAAKTAHLLFVSLNDESKLRRALKEYGVLTVGQSDAFARNGGIITFTFEDDKLRFEINIGAAEQAGLKISSQLQKLARNVRKGP